MQQLLTAIVLQAAPALSGLASVTAGLEHEPSSPSLFHTFALAVFALLLTVLVIFCKKG